MPRTKNKDSAKNSNGATLGFEEKMWKAADKMRGNIDASEYKHVVLGLIFLKYISDAFQERYDALKAEEFADPEDRDEYSAFNVFWVPKEARWAHLQANAKQPTIGKIVDDAMVAIERENPTLRGVLPKDYGRPQLDKHRLGELIDLIGTIGLGDAESRSGDVLGRVYEYFLGQFASVEGKGGGEFYTPRSVVQLLVEMIEPYKGRVYDPCCGSGGMFVQSEKFVEAHGGRIGDLSIYGQESNHTTWRLCKMNLAIRGIEGNIGEKDADTFHKDQHKDLKADFILANPPFNVSDWGGDRVRDDVRWKFGAPPEGNANFAWVQHIIHHLAPNGIAGFVLSEVALSSGSGTENAIRQKIVESDLLDCIVTLPEKLFYTTPIPASLWFLTRNKDRHEKCRNRQQQTLFIDASKLGKEITRTHRELTQEDLSLIVEVYHSWRTEGGDYRDVSGFCKSVSNEDIEKHEFNFQPAAYIDPISAIHNLSQKEVETDIGHNFASANHSINLMAELISNLNLLAESNNVHKMPKLKIWKLSDVLEKSTERLGSGQEPEILTCTETAGLVFQRERFAKRVATSDTSKYKIVRRTDIVYNPYLLWLSAIDQCWITDVGITSPAYEVLRVKEGFDPALVGFILRTKEMIARYKGISIGTVQRRRRAPVEKFLELDIALPEMEFQRVSKLISMGVQDLAAQSRDVNRLMMKLQKDFAGLWLSNFKLLE